MKAICCPNCGLQVSPPSGGLGEVPVEVLVADDDGIRLAQMKAASAGLDYKHSASIASNRGEVYK